MNQAGAFGRLLNVGVPGTALAAADDDGLGDLGLPAVPAAAPAAKAKAKAAPAADDAALAELMSLAS